MRVQILYYFPLKDHWSLPILLGREVFAPLRIPVVGIRIRSEYLFRHLALSETAPNIDMKYPALFESALRSTIRILSADTGF